MKHKWWLLPAALVLIGVLWVLVGDRAHVESIQTALGLKTAAVEARKSKPVCSQVIVPAGTDCIPQHIANLPPDPGPEGMKTIDGIDADNDGIRDDVQRFIAENWGHSPRAVKVLTLIAETKLLGVHHGGDLGREGTQKLASRVFNAGSCYFHAMPEEKRAQAMDLVQIKVMNTPERLKRAHAFNYMLAHQVYDLGNETPAQLCGFDPAAFQP